MSNFIVSLGSLINLAPLRRANSGNFPILSMTMHHGLVDQGDKFKKRVASQDTSTYKVVRRGQLVVGFPIDEGVLAFQEKYEEAIVSPAYEVWDILDPERIDRVYLQRFLRSPRALAYYAAKLQGTTARRRSLPKDVFLGLPVVLPDLLGQRAVVRVLDHVDVLRAKRRQAIALFDDLARSIFLDMFGDPARNPMRWREVNFGDVITDGPVNGLYKPASAYGTGVPIVRIDSFHSGKIVRTDNLKRVSANPGEIARYGLRVGDILVNRVNSMEYLGKSAHVSRVGEPMVFESNMMRISIDSRIVDSKFLVALLQNFHIKSQILAMAKRAVNQASINQGDVRSLRFPLPPLRLQQDFVGRLEHLEYLRSRAVAHLTELDALLASLQHRAFRSELWSKSPAPVSVV